MKLFKRIPPKKWDVEITRQVHSESEPYVQKLIFESEDAKETVASMLEKINSGVYQDVNGDSVSEISWECSCLQKKCGACAMVINNMPRLACDSFLRDFNGKIVIRPLSKFKVIRDLIVDRASMYKHLQDMRVWSEDRMRITEAELDVTYEASRCLQCGCCLEVCPNFSFDETFFGAASFVPGSRLMTKAGNQDKEFKANYSKHGYDGCGKSLACANICPAKIDIQHLMVKSNHELFRK